MSDQNLEDGDTSLQQHYTVFIQNARIYARNVRRKTIDLGQADTGKDGSVSYRLDAGDFSGDGLADADAALRDLAGKLDFIYLDEQFTSLPDRAEFGETHDAKSVPHIVVTLDETDDGSSGADSRGGATPHIF
jgi:hypothetical protein